MNEIREYVVWQWNGEHTLLLFLINIYVMIQLSEKTNRFKEMQLLVAKLNAILYSI